MMSLTGIRGNHAERMALRFLKKNKLRFVEKNYHCRYGEIDIIMQDKEYLVFVEVRYRRSDRFGGALASVDRRKQAKLRRSAEHYLIRHKRTDDPCRFDILCVNGDLNKPSFDWIDNAF